MAIASAAAEAPSYTLALEVSIPVKSQIIVWYSKIDCRIMGCNPMALAVMKTPAACGADVAVGEGQPLGMPLAYGGPYLGFMVLC